ncbi:MAG: LacI family transcriptional regulator [Hyphomicrobiales bacterium]|nr:LacI family transcriptional regulator [Hyphomicrobiales bacterium]
MAPPEKAATLKNVAKEAGVSLGMASRVLGNYGSYSERTRKAVLKAAAKLDYRPNGIARSLRLRRTRAIGVMISDIVSYHWTVFVQGVEEAARSAGFHVILCNTADDAELEKAYLNDLRERGVDGIIVSPLEENYQHFSQLAETGFRLVLVGSRIPGTEVTRIVSDDRLAATDAVAYLTSLGHERIGVVAGLMTLESGRNRLDGYKDGLLRAGLSFDQDLVAYGDYRKDKAFDAARRLITMENPPTALLVCNELMTGAALECLKVYDVAIPEQISLIGFDDPPWADFYRPSITTLREERFNMGRLACNALVAAIQDTASGFAGAPEMRLKTELVVRESCGLRRQSAGAAIPGGRGQPAGKSVLAHVGGSGPGS